MKQRIAVTRLDMLHEETQVAPQAEGIGHLRCENEIFHVHLHGVIDHPDHAVAPRQQLAQQGWRKTGTRLPRVHIPPGNLWLLCGSKYVVSCLYAFCWGCSVVCTACRCAMSISA